jgi:Putative capsular polysaccharide synthesis protein
MLVRWYQTHKRYGGQKLKVITLTRDPISFYRSIFIQRRGSILPRILSWQRARLGSAADAPTDEARAVQDFVMELASIIAAAGDVENGEACTALAHNRWPHHPIVAQEVDTWLRPLRWFDTEITEIFGLNVLREPELRERGWAALQNDWVEIFVLRFEQLNALVPKMAEFAGLAGLTLPERNVTSRKTGASQYQAAIQAALDTPPGQACVRALRASAYARACGYGKPTQ